VSERRYRIVVCRGPECGDRRGSRAVYDAFRRVIDARGVGGRCELGWQSCFGRCTQGPNVLVREIAEGGSEVPRATALYNGVDAMNADEVVTEHVERGVVVRRLVLGLGLALLVTAAGCKGKTIYKDTPETLEKLTALEGQMKAKDDLITSLRKENADLTLGAGGGTAGELEWVFTIEGDALTIKARPGGGGSGVPDDSVATGSADQFLDIVEKSRGSIQKCYENALKKSTGLASRTVNLKLVASFGSTGAFRNVSFSPDLPEAFDSCLRTVASRWKMPAAKGSMRFQASVKLTPT
jgi:(2Fe-2S) ferredoxin